MESTIQPSRNNLMEFLKGRLTENELQVSVVYIYPDIGPGESLVIDRKRMVTDTPGYLIFIDFEPGVNWSHHCRYLLFGKDNKVKLDTNGQFPPETEKLQLLCIPPGTEDWMLLTDKVYRLNQP